MKLNLPLYLKEKPTEIQQVILCFRGDYRTRTGHLQIANLTLYQMS